MSKFDNIPVDKGTRFLIREEETFGGLDCLYEFWVWKGIKAESLVFAHTEVPSITKLLDEIRFSDLVLDKTSEITTKISKGYFFVNFNFITE